jgi:hypothetical protein
MNYQKPLNRQNETQKATKTVDYIANAVHKEEGGDKTYWTRIGVAFKNKPREDGTDGGYTVLLNAVPTNGKLVLSVPLPKEE